jgi:hypothetical protein
MNNRIARLAWAVIFVLMVSACASPEVVRRYEGQEKHRSEIVVLYNNPATGVRIYKIDGQELASRLTTWNGSEGVKEVHLLPGTYSVIGLVSAQGGSAFYEKQIQVEAGNRYRMRYENVGNGVVRVFAEKLTPDASP